MKKILALSLVFILTALCLTACGEKTLATNNVIAMIKSIGDVTDKSGEYLDEIESAYIDLNDEEKRDVSNYSKYEKAREEYNEINDFNLQVLAVTDAATTDFSVEGVSFDELITSGEDLLKQYDKMSKKRKACVTSEIENMQSAIEKIESYRVQAVKCAATYCKAFLEVYKANNYEITDIGCICQIRNDTQYMFFALTAKNDKKEKSYYSQARFADANVYSSIVENADYFFATEPVNESSDALANRNLNLSVEEVMNEINNPTEVTTAAVTTAEATTVPATTTPATTVAATTAPATTKEAK